MFGKWVLGDELARTCAGPATVWLQQPVGQVSGPANLFLDPDGRVKIAIEIDEFSIPAEYHGFLIAFLRGNLADVEGNRTTFREANGQMISKLEVPTG